MSVKPHSDKDKAPDCIYEEILFQQGNWMSKPKENTYMHTNGDIVCNLFILITPESNAHAACIHRPTFTTWQNAGFSASKRFS